MVPLLSLCGAALVLFAATNLDDLLLLVVISSDLRRRYPPLAVLAGQLLGFSVVLLVSLVGFWSGLIVPERWMAGLGVLPLALGVRQLLSLRRQGAFHGSAGQEASSGFLGHPERGTSPTRSFRRTGLKVAALTLANGSDNVSVYLPLFGRLNPLELVITVITFLVALVALWFLSQWLSRHHLWQHRLQTITPRLSPLVLIALGLWLLKDSVLWP